MISNKTAIGDLIDRDAINLRAWGKRLEEFKDYIYSAHQLRFQGPEIMANLRTRDFLNASQCLHQQVQDFLDQRTENQAILIKSRV